MLSSPLPERPDSIPNEFYGNRDGCQKTTGNQEGFILEAPAGGCRRERRMSEGMWGENSWRGEEHPPEKRTSMMMHSQKNEIPKNPFLTEKT
jgi:hypothetical protein